MGNTRLELNIGAADKKIRIYPTLSCNMRCTYCSNGPTGGTGVASIPSQAWVDGLKKLKGSKFEAVHFTGGEPFLYPGLVDLVNATPLDLGVFVYTNLTLPPFDFIKNLKRPLDVRGSLHAPGDSSVYRSHVEAFHKCDFVRGISLVMVGGSPANVMYRRHFAHLNDIVAVVADNQWGKNAKTSGVRMTVRCRNKVFLFGPDGGRYSCVTYMKKGWRIPTEPFFWDTDWKNTPWDIVTQECHECGCCAACDGIIDSTVEKLHE